MNLSLPGDNYNQFPSFSASAGAIPLGMGPIGPAGPSLPTKSKKEETMTL